MHTDLVSLGYVGSYGRVAAFVRAWKAERQRDAQTSGRGTFVPLVFAPGEAFQFDWSEDWASLGGEGDRFTNGTYGVFYAGRTIETAIAETRYHRIRFLRATSEPAQELDMRVYDVDLDAELHDIRAMRKSHPAYYHPTSYGVS